MDPKSPSVPENNVSTRWKFFRFLDSLLGMSVGIALSAIFAYYVCALHESHLWFSNIREVEREISMRTESGLYYSYFKEFFPSTERHRPVLEVIDHLMHDKITEYPREINTLQRFNIIQEVGIALLYRSLQQLNMFPLPQPIIFYVYTCFFFTGIGLLGLYCLAWKLGQHWTFGLLAASWMFAHIDHSTRAFFAVNLRENFAISIFTVQTFFILCCLTPQPKNSSKANKFLNIFYLECVLASTFIFSLLWQFNQYILALQSASLLATTIIIPRNMDTQMTTNTSKLDTSDPKVFLCILLAQSLGFALLIPFQFFQPLLLSSLNLNVNFAILIWIYIFPLSHNTSSKNVLFRLIFIALTTFCLNFTLKYLLNIQSDTHIFRFLCAKLGIYIGEVPFESAIYVCHGAFSFIGYDFFLQTKNSGLLLLYLIALLLVGIGAIWYFYSKNSIKNCKDFQTPQVIFLTVQSVLCGALAIMTMRLKYLWFPHMAALAAYVPIVLDRYIGRWARLALVIAVSCILLYSQYNEYQRQMNNEQEFYDPDTVDLMEWINTLPDGTVFTGSMQLLAGVKACTGRPITNHPHFEDKWLRKRTERLYQIYGRRSVSDVHKILKSESTTHIILEDSICLHHSDGCSINDLVDLSNGHSTDSNSTRFSTKLVPSPIERFCNKVREYGRESKEFFKLVFENRTFRVYQLL